MNLDDATDLEGVIEVATEGDGSLVTLRGEIDVSLRGAASASMVQVASRGGPVVIDAAGVTFIDSSGLAFVLQLHRLSTESDQRCALRDPPALILELLALIGMEGRIPLEFTPGDADGPDDGPHDADVFSFEPTVA